MGRFFILLVLCVTVISCNSKKKSAQDDDTVVINNLEELHIDEKSDIVYISSDEQYSFSIISVQKDGEIEKILLQNDISGRIYDMKRVNSYTGERYLDEENYYFWINGETFSFGKDDEVIVEGRSELKFPADIE